MADCCSHKEVRFNILDHKVLLLAVAVVAALAGSYAWPVLLPFRLSFMMYARMLVWPLLLGLVMGGIVDQYVPREYVSVVLAGRRKRNIIYAVTWGFLMTLCSHGILALAVQLYKKGASASSVVAFLLASPWANFPLTLMLIGFFGLGKALFIIFSAIVIALIVGWIFQILEVRGIVETNPDTVGIPPGLDIMADNCKRAEGYHFDFIVELKGIFKGIRELAGMILWWILLGTTLAAVAGAYIPTGFFHRFMGNSVGGMFGTLLAATVIETCSSGSSPLAFEIYRQTGALGNALMFLLGGVATNYTEVALLWVNIGRRTALWMPALCIPLIFLFGAIGNAFFR